MFNGKMDEVLKKIDQCAIALLDALGVVGFVFFAMAPKGRPPP